MYQNDRNCFYLIWLAFDFAINHTDFLLRLTKLTPRDFSTMELNENPNKTALYSKRHLDGIVAYGFIRKLIASEHMKQSQQCNELELPSSLKDIVVAFCHIPLVFDATDLGPGYTTRCKGNVVRKEVDCERQVNDQYSFVFLDGDFYFGVIHTRFRIVEQGTGCCDITIGVVERSEYDANYVSHSSQTKQTPYRMVAGYTGYTGCLDVGQEINTEVSPFNDEESSFASGDVIDLTLDFRTFCIEFRKNDLLIHQKSMKKDTVYKISVHMWDFGDAVELV